MKPRLGIFDQRGKFVIAWDDEGCPGLCLGDGEKLADDEHDAATGAAELICNPHRCNDGSLAWETMSDATKALRAARAAVSATRQNRAWPDWAIQAKAEGWTPPKGWIAPKRGHA